MIAPQYISDWGVWFKYFHTYGSFSKLEKSMMVSRAKIFSSKDYHHPEPTLIPFLRPLIGPPR